MTQQTNAQRLANELRAELLVDHASPYKTVNASKRLLDESAAELRRLSAIEEIADELQDLCERQAIKIAAIQQERDQLRAQLAALKDGQAGGEVVAYKVNWPGVDSVGMRRFYGADEWEASKATVEFFGGVAIPLTATPKPVPMTEGDA